MFQTKRSVSSGMALLAVFCLAATVAAQTVPPPPRGSVPSSDGLFAYNPATGEAWMWEVPPGEWVEDPDLGSNRAYVEYVAGQNGGGPFSPKTWKTLDDYSLALALSSQFTSALADTVRDYSIKKVSSSSTPSYAVSETPKWDIFISAGGGYASSDFTIDATGARYKANSTTYSLSVDACKDRFKILNDFQYRHSAGMGLWKDLDSRTLSWSFMPGYSFLLQEEAGVQADAFMLLGLAHMDTDHADTDCRFTPGIGLALSRVMYYGILKAAYTFTHSRSLNGDDQVTGTSRINLHGVALNYAAAITKSLFATAGADYVYACQVPSSMANEFATARVGLSLMNLGPWSVSAGYQYRFMGGSGNGGDLRVTYAW